MKRIAIMFVAILTTSFLAAQEPWHIEMMPYDAQVPLVKKVKIRTGYWESSPEVPFRGDILYLQGFADSMLNHAPLFGALSQNGYRIIAFDYMGQGESEGTMNHTRLQDDLFPSLNISTIAQKVWKKYAHPDSKKIVIGWSTGGLAAYEMAHSEWADAVILIAPGIHVKTVIEVTLETLTGAAGNYPAGKDPHIDPIKPNSPLEAPLFATNLVFTSHESQSWTISSRIPGLVLLSGTQDKYVDSIKTGRTLQTQAPHFIQVHFPDALHEIDNENANIQEKLIREVEAFLFRISQ